MVGDIILIAPRTGGMVCQFAGSIDVRTGSPSVTVGLTAGSRRVDTPDETLPTAEFREGSAVWNHPLYSGMHKITCL